MMSSWNDGPAKQAIIAFGQAMTDHASHTYVPPDDRIATFDQDGTLWVSHPLYTQAMFALDRVHELAPKHPEWKKKEPFKAVLASDREGDWAQIIAATHAGMSTEAFTQWLATAKDLRWKRPYTDLVYQPMLEVIDSLRGNGVRTDIVTGGGQEFVRVYSDRVYGVPPEQVVGSSIATKYEVQDSKPVPRAEDLFHLHRRSRRQGDRHQPVHRQAAECCVRQLRRRSRDAGVDASRRRRTADDAGAARRCRARVCLRPRQ